MRGRGDIGADAGQSLTELAILLPVLFLLFFGVYAAADYTADRQIAGQAVRAGARLGSELGNDHYFPGSPKTAACQLSTTSADPCAVDSQIIRSVQTITHDLNFISKVDEIDIYQPCFPAGSSTCTADSRLCSPSATGGLNGSYRVGEPADVYLNSGNGLFALSAAGAGYPLSLRTQVHPNEAAVGVRVVYHYAAPVPIVTFFNGTAQEYTAMCFAPFEAA